MGAFSEHYNLVRYESNHLHYSDKATLSETAVFHSKESDHLHYSDKVSLTEHKVLTRYESNHLQYSEKVTLTQNATITPKDSYQKGYNVAYFSLEMPLSDCFRRVMARVADVPAYGLRDSKLNKTEVQGVKQACRFMKDYPYHLDIIDVPRGFSVAQLELAFEELKSSYTPDVIIIDYADLLIDGSQKEERHKQNKIWKDLRGLNQKRKCLLITATQTDAGSYKNDLLFIIHNIEKDLL
jgi:replicative DNA helicase